MSRPSDPAADLRVLLSVPPPRATTNPYVVMLAQALRDTDGVEVHHFDWRRALTGHYDVLHVHWPENLARGNGGLRTAGRHALTGALLSRLWTSRTPIVRTLHNIEPHERPALPTRRLLTAVDRLTAATVSLNTLTPTLPGVPNTVIPHGHYRSWYERWPQGPARPGQLVSFGAVRPYKNLPSLLSAFSGVVDRDLRLTVAGTCPDPSLAAELTDLAHRDPRIDLRLQFLADEELVAAVTRSELVVLPYREMHNSGAALAALSLGRPVLVPANPVTDALAAEVGQYWVRRYSGKLTAEVLRDAMLGPPGPGVEPDLAARDWHTAGERHRDVYRMAVAAARP